VGWVHGRGGAGMGGRLGVPAGTVRWRLSVGIERLRARLDDRHGGDRARWAAVLAATLGAAPVPVAAAAAGAGKPALVLAAALGLIAIGGYASWGGGTAATPTAGSPPARPSAGAPAGGAPPPPPRARGPPSAARGGARPAA